MVSNAASSPAIQRSQRLIKQCSMLERRLLAFPGVALPSSLHSLVWIMPLPHANSSRHRGIKHISLALLPLISLFSPASAFADLNPQKHAKEPVSVTFYKRNQRPLVSKLLLSRRCGLSFAGENQSLTTPFS